MRWISLAAGKAKNGIAVYRVTTRQPFLPCEHAIMINVLHCIRIKISQAVLSEPPMRDIIRSQGRNDTHMPLRKDHIRPEIIRHITAVCVGATGFVGGLFIEQKPD